eukprot:CAMPEP_0184673442 /NCGR_PEP_ID=MMETSP0308-20130426/86679_1 /TAXON_ID=38269 /ORGANISM="Gloeochaete witrockiana, Strain SAG 46.84" /LENGTH=472 /DNA_ID=CAMNT_0027120923 /DNA_START=588 /DNA_END=2007 /DNA_ORIENTATION=-
MSAPSQKTEDSPNESREIPPEMLWGNVEAYWNRVMPYSLPTHIWSRSGLLADLQAMFTTYLFSTAYAINMDSVKAGAESAYRAVFQHFSEPGFSGDDRALRGMISEKLHLAFEQQFEERRKRNLRVESEVRDIKVRKVLRRIYIHSDLSSSGSRPDEITELGLFMSDRFCMLMKLPNDEVSAVNDAFRNRRLRFVFELVMKALNANLASIMFEHDVHINLSERFALYESPNTFVAGSAKLLQLQAMFTTYLFSTAYAINMDSVKAGAESAYRAVFQHFSEPGFSGDDRALRGMISEKLHLAFEQQFEERRKRNLRVESEVQDIKVRQVLRLIVIHSDLSSSGSRPDEITEFGIFFSDRICVLLKLPNDEMSAVNDAYRDRRPRILFQLCRKALDANLTSIMFEHFVHINLSERFALYKSPNTFVAGSAKLLRNQSRIFRLNTTPLYLKDMGLKPEFTHRFMGVYAPEYSRQS